MIDSIVTACDPVNAGHDITSFLFFDGQYLLQTLEGPREALLACFRRIQKDPRHVQVLPFAIQPLNERRLPVPCFKVVVNSEVSAPINGLGCFPYQRPEFLEALHALGLRQLKDAATS